MSDVVIKVENLWKEYRLGVVNHGTLKRDLQSWWARARGQDDPNRRIDAGRVATPDSPDRFWALRDVSFDVRQGEVLGIIGRNGAGKSTLLKILSRVTTPSRGEVKIRGRVASLLEVGTGFHPELTGRENIFLNGAILGMSKAEIRGKLDEIIDFSGVEKFIDTPVKRYSSGMYVRLAFAVAAHLDPEILIIDEVLAVGDAEFQQKCLGKMGEVAKGGRTVLFVSHNMGVVANLCEKGLFLDAGSVNFSGGINECIGKYCTPNASKSEVVEAIRTPSQNQKLIIKSVSLSNKNKIIDNNNDLFVNINYEILSAGKSYALGIEVTSLSRGVVFTSSTLDDRPHIDRGVYEKIGDYSARVKVPLGWFLDGSYSIRVAAAIPSVEVLDVFPEEVIFTVHDSSSPVAILGEGRRGVLAPRLEWLVEASQ